MIASDSDIKTLNGTIGWCCFIMVWIFFVSGFLFWWKMCDISADIREIRATVVQRAKEYHNLDTMEVKK